MWRTCVGGLKNETENVTSVVSLEESKSARLKPAATSGEKQIPHAARKGREGVPLDDRGKRDDSFLGGFAARLKPCPDVRRWRSLEPEDRTEGYAQVVVRAVVEVDFVAEFKAQSQRAEAGLRSCSRIHGRVQAGGANAEERALKRGKREEAWAEAEIDKAGFQRDERAQPTLRGPEGRPEQAMRDTDGRASDGSNVAIGNVGVRLLEVDPIVVREFAFDHHFAMNAVAEASAEPEIAGTGLGNAEVIEKYAGLDALLGQQARGSCAQKNRYEDRSELARHSVHLLGLTR